MPKNSFQDVVPPDPNRRTIRNVSINKRPRKVEQKAEEMHYAPAPDPEPIREEQVVEHVVLPPNRQVPKKSSSTSKIFVSVAVVAILAFIFVMMNAFTSATITIHPKKENVSFNTSVLAALSSSTLATSTPTIKYEVIKLSKEASAEAPASGEETAQLKASGKIVIYNNFSAEPQRLITRTRFKTSDGFIFRINESIVVPGKTSVGPGSIEATVYADEAGEKYNIGLSDFTVPGFKSDPAMYKGFYARSKDKMAGGFIGQIKKVSDADRKAASTAIEAGIKADLEKQLSSQVPDNLVVLNGGIIYDFTNLPQESSGSNALIKEEGTAYAIAFDKKELASLIEKNFLKTWGGIGAEIKDFSKMSVTFDDPSWKPGKGSSVGVKISGSADVAALIDTSSLADQLAGRPKTELSKIINNSPAIESAEAAVRPVWKSGFPGNRDKINVSVDY